MGRVLLVAVIVVTSGCDRGPQRSDRPSSVTVRLPAARPPIASPGFSFEIEPVSVEELPTGSAASAEGPELR